MECSTEEIRKCIRKCLYSGFGLGFIVGLLFGLGIQKAHAHSEFHECCTLDQRIEVASVEPTAESISGKSTAVLDKYLLEEYKPLKLINGIINTPGVVTKDITGLGSIRIRGARSFDTKYLYDGFPLKDPSHPQGSFGAFFGDTIGFGPSEIQILKGSGSVLYGSEAIGGVVGIVPVKVERPTYRVEYGSRESILQSFDHELASIAYSDSIDGETVNLRLSKQFDHFKPFLIYQSTDSPLHNGPGITTGIQTVDSRDENDRRELEYYQAGVKVDYEPFTAKLSYADSSRRFVFLPNKNGSGFYSDGFFNGQTLYSDINVKILDTILGYSYQRDFMEIEIPGKSDTTDLYQNDFYVERSIDIDRLNILLGARYSLHELSKDRPVADISASYKFDNDVILSSHYGTGFRSPSLYELNGAFLSSFGRTEVGNRNLSPERSTSFDVGLEKTFNETITTGLTVFRHSLTNRIDFVGSRYSNIAGDLNTYGYEAFYEHFLFGNSSLRLSYTRTIQSGLVDISPNIYEATFRVHKKKWQLATSLGYKDAHEIRLFNNTTFVTDRLTEPSAVTSNATLTYALKENISIYGRLENFFNQEYRDGGYEKESFGIYGGVTVKL